MTPFRGSLWAIVLSLLCPALAAPSEPLRFERLTSDDGLSQMNVLQIFQDQLGFMWFVTQDGLDRFDGADFEHLPGVGGPMWQAPDGALWIGDRGRGVRRYDPASRLLEEIGRDIGEGQLSNRRVLAIAPFGRHLWVGTQSGLDRIDLETLTIEQVFPAGDEALPVYSLLEVDGALIVGTEHSLLRRGDDGEFETIFELDESLGGLRTVLRSRDGSYWIGGAAGLDRLDPGTGAVTNFRHDPEDPQSVPPGPVITLLEDRRGTLWGGWVASGLGRFVPGSNDSSSDRSSPGRSSPGRFERVQIDLGSADSANGGGGVSSLFEDQAGALWVGLAPGGLRWTYPESGHFDLYQQNAEDAGSLSSNIVLALEEGHGGEVWVGTWFTGLNRLDPETGLFERFRHDPEDPHSLGHNRIHDVMMTPSGALWIAFRDGGLGYRDPATGHFSHFRHDPDDPESLSHDRVMSVALGPDGELWVGTVDGLDRLDASKSSPESGSARFEHFRHDPNDPRGLPHSHIQHLRPHGDAIWVSTWGGGIAKLDPRRGLFESIQHDPADPTSLGHDVVRSTFIDSVGRLWVATNGHGLDMRLPGEDSFRHFRAGDGLVHDVVQGVLEDDLGRLWIPTNGGLSRYDPTLDAWKSFDASDGLQHAEFNFGAFHRGASGRFYLGGIQGFNTFDPSDFPRVTEAPKAVLTHFSGLGLEIEIEREAPFLDELRLAHDQNAFSFEIAALSYRRADRNRYRYRLDPFDEQWIEAGSRRFASYTNVPSGDYTLRAQVADADGIWSEETALLDLGIATPPWRSWWAYSLYSALLGGLIFGYSRWQRLEVERQREINRRLRDIDRMKDEFLANTSHELRTPLFGITGLAESMIDGVHGDLPSEVSQDLEMICSSGHRLSRLVGDLLDFSKLERGRLKIRPRPVDLHALTDVVLTLSRPLQQSDAVELRNEVSRDLPPVHADEERLQQILHNLIGNAVKFTAEGTVEIGAHVIDDQLEVSVSDTGIGIAEEHLERIFSAFEQADASIERSFGGTGLGLAVARGLVEAHGSRLKVVSSRGEGSIFSFRLPFADEAEVESARNRGRLFSSSVNIPVDALQEQRGNPKNDSEKRGEDREGDGAHILVVDDEPVNLRVLANFLAEAGYRVSTASNGADALEHLEAGDFELVLLDVMMPKMSGYEVCRSIREQRAVEELPVIFLTAKSQDTDLIAGFSEGGNDYLSKPVTKAELLARISLHLRILKAYRHQLAEVKVLGGMLPICSSCKKIRNDDGYWSQLETFLREHSGTRFTHGLCPSCLDELKQQLE